MHAVDPFPILTWLDHYGHVCESPWYTDLSENFYSGGQNCIENNHDSNWVYLGRVLAYQTDNQFQETQFDNHQLFMDAISREIGEPVWKVNIAADENLADGVRTSRRKSRCIGTIENVRDNVKLTFRRASRSEPKADADNPPPYSAIADTKLLRPPQQFEFQTSPYEATKHLQGHTSLSSSAKAQVALTVPNASYRDRSSLSRTLNCPLEQTSTVEEPLATQMKSYHRRRQEIGLIYNR